MTKTLKLAIEIVKQSLTKKYNFVAIITDKRNRILSIGKNSYTKTSPLQAHYAKQVNEDDKIYLHAEIDALIRIKEGKPYNIYIARVDKKGIPALAKPCSICQKAIADAGIKNIYYTKDNKSCG